jgi:hypothetical protein
MKYENIRNYSDEQFRRITGVKRETFEMMLRILRPKLREKLSNAAWGRKPTLALEEALLAALEYWREYRAYAHIAASYGIRESNMYRLIKWIENVLIKDGTFSLPGKKALVKKDTEYQIVLIDVTETPIERPKRGKNTTILVKRNDIR